MINHLANAPEILISRNKFGAENWTLRHIGAGLGLLGGTLLLAGACFLTVIELVYSEKTHGVWLFLPVLPLWLFGAHCFDQIETAEKAAKLEYGRKHGLSGGQWR